MCAQDVAIEEEVQGEGCVLTLREPLVIETSPELRKALMRLARQKVAAVVVNLEGAGRVDTSGLATLFECGQAIGRYGGKLLVVGLDAQSADTFALAQLKGAFLTFDTQAGALASLKRL